MDANLVESLDTMFTIFGGIAMFAVLISLWKDNKTFAVTRVALNAFAVFLGVLSGNGWLALIWAFTTVVSLARLAMLNGKKNE